MNPVKPKYNAVGFTCPHCNVYAKQIFEVAYKLDSNRYYNKLEKLWAVLEDNFFLPRDTSKVDNLSISFCEHCNKYCVWVDKVLVYPNQTIAPLPSKDMPDNVKEDFLEARLVVQKSPRSSAALLRLALQKLMPHLGMKGNNLNSDINELCQRGISKEIQEALDVVRVIGNESVHPGELDMRDDLETALLLFDIVNWIVDSTISPKKKTKNLLSNKIPKSKLTNIENRNFTFQKKSN